MQHELLEALERATGLLAELDDSPPADPPSVGDLQRELQRYRRDLEAERADRDQLAGQMISAERQAARIMALYVATHQLHATLLVEDVYAAIGEIATDLLGAESFAVLLHDEDSDGWTVGLAKEIDADLAPLFKGSRYPGGLRLVDDTLTDGILRLSEEGSSAVIAAVPLRVQNGILGVLAVFRLFRHRTSTLHQDRDLLDLLSAHVGSALLAAESYSAADRKLRTLKDLVSLLP